jgi:hypothetical protein
MPPASRQLAPTKRKWFQVIRVSALLTTGMRGIKLCVGEHRAIRRSAPLGAFSPPLASPPYGSPQPLLSLSAGSLRS